MGVKRVLSVSYDFTRLKFWSRESCNRYEAAPATGSHSKVGIPETTAPLLGDSTRGAGYSL